LTPMRTAIKDIRTKWNDYVASQLPEDVAFKASLKKQNLMYDAVDILSEKAARGAPTKVGEIGTNRFGRFLQRNPKLKTAAKYAGAGAAGATGIKIVD